MYPYVTNGFKKTVCKIQYLIYFIFEKRQLGFLFRPLLPPHLPVVLISWPPDVPRETLAVDLIGLEMRGPPEQPASGRRWSPPAGLHMMWATRAASKWPPVILTSRPPDVLWGDPVGLIIQCQPWHCYRHIVMWHSWFPCTKEESRRPSTLQKEGLLLVPLHQRRKQMTLHTTDGGASPGFCCLHIK